MIELKRSSEPIENTRVELLQNIDGVLYFAGRKLSEIIAQELPKLNLQKSNAVVITDENGDVATEKRKSGYNKDIGIEENQLCESRDIRLASPSYRYSYQFMFMP